VSIVYEYFRWAIAFRVPVVISVGPYQSTVPESGGSPRRRVVASTSAMRSLTKIAGKPYDRLSDDGKLTVLDHGKVGWAETYVNEIPAKYKIIGRTRDPYLVELTAVERVR